MKSKRFYLIITVLIISAALVACSNNGKPINASAKEGIQPYNLSENERYLLQSFGMEGNSQIISFNAPKEVISLEVKVYKLGDSKKWDIIGTGGISIGKEREPIDKLFGTFTMQLRKGYVIEYNINTIGRASFITDEIILDKEEIVVMKGFLQEYQYIEIDKEIPVAIMVYSSRKTLKNYSLEDYSDPTKFGEKDLVKVVTLTFKGE